MNAFDLSRRELIAALFLDYHRNSGALVDFDELKERFTLKVSRSEWFDPIVSEIEHLLIMSRTFDGVSVRIHPRGYGEILREILQQIEGSTLEVSWSKEEILSDGLNIDWLPVPNGWKFLQLAPDKPIPPAAAPASDRIVRFDHNHSTYKTVEQGLQSVHEDLRSANNLPIEVEERDRILTSLVAAQALWRSAQLKIIQVKVGILLAIEDAGNALSKIGKAVAADLLVDTIKSLVKSLTGIDLDSL